MSLLLFPVFAILASLYAYWQPGDLVGFKSWIVPLLMMVMLGMGLTLSYHDFKKVWQYRFVVVMGVVLQFLIMPLTAYLLSIGMALDEALLIGMVLVGVTAGGTASNVMTFLAKGNVALSVSMTIVSTLLSVVMMPLLSLLYLGQMVEVPVNDMLLSLVKIILVPIAVGMFLRVFIEQFASKSSFQLSSLAQISSVFSMLAIVFIIAIVVALNNANFADLALPLLLAVMLHNLIGLFSGYWATRWLGYDSLVARTVAIEVGMQNSGLSVALALKFFTPLSALPGALFSLWHNVSGIFFASYFAKKSAAKL